MRPSVRPVQHAAAVAATLLLAACGEAPGIAGHIETLDERMKREEAEFNATPDIKGEALVAALHALGIADGWMTPEVEEHGVDIWMLRVPPENFERIDKPALARLMLDSRYRVDMADPVQAREMAFYMGAETNKRDKAKAIRELTERGQIDSFPRYNKRLRMDVYAPRLEAWCGYDEGDALEVIDGDWLNYRHNMVDMAVEDVNDGRPSASFDCIKRVVDATDLRRHFIGNRGREGAIDY